MFQTSYCFHCVDLTYRHKIWCFKHYYSAVLKYTRKKTLLSSLGFKNEDPAYPKSNAVKLITT